MKSLLNISPEDIATLYIKHNIRPSNGNVYIKNGTCCALGIIAKDSGFDTDELFSLEELLSHAGLEPNGGFLFGFGFDAGLINSKFPNDGFEAISPFYKHGYNIGQYIRELTDINAKII